MLIAAIQTARALDMDSYISIAVLIAVIGGIWKLSALLQDIKNKLHSLRHVPARQTHIENHLLMFEEDVNNLFAAVRAQADPDRLFEFTRRTRFKAWVDPDASA